METLNEVLAGLVQLLVALVYLILTPVGPLLFGVVALLVFGMILLARFINH